MRLHDTVGAQNISLTYSPTSVEIEQEHWQSLSYLPNTAQAGQKQLNV